MNFAPTEQQELIFSAITQGTHNLAVRAGAGCAKTSSIIEAMNILGNDGERTVFLAFSRDIKEEAAKKCPEWVEVKTFNGLGYSGLFRMGIKGKPDTRKPRALAREVDPKNTFTDLLKAIGLARAFGLVPEGIPADPVGLIEDVPRNYNQIIAQFGLQTGTCDAPASLIREALRLCIKWAWQGKMIDFDDQLYLPVIYKQGLPQYDRIFIDEAQDLSHINRGLLHLIIKPTSKIIAVGDPDQAIYGFRGADHNSFAAIVEEFDCRVLPLSQTFRCPKAVVKYANKYVPSLEAFSTNPEGYAGPWPKDQRMTATEVATGRPAFPQPTDFAGKPGSPVAVLCRNNAPLMRLCFRLIRDGIAAQVLGRDIGKSMAQLLRKEKRAVADEALAFAWDRGKKEMARLINQDRAEMAALIEDKLEALQSIRDLFPPDDKVSTDRLLAKLQEMYEENPDRVVVLSTIHKAKGLEFPTVFILDPQLMPSKWARGQDALKQEDNLAYVAVTRSQGDLFFIESDED